MSDIIQTDDIWYPPSSILFHGSRKLGDKTISSSLRKVIRESMSTAIMLVGIEKMTGATFYLQPVGQNEQTPDVRTMSLDLDSDPDMMLIQEVEVVTLEDNSDESVDDFLKRTKLSPFKSYPPTTVILCHFDKTSHQTKSWMDVHKSIKETGSKLEVYVLARVDGKTQKYQLVQVNPVINLVEYDVTQELTAKPPKTVLKMRRSKDKRMIPTGEVNIPFSILS